MMERQNNIQVKICGLTHPGQAVECALAGADAIGVVFFAKSPRFVDDKQAADIDSALPENICRVGVFVDESYDFIMQKVSIAGLNMAQLHGQEAPGLAKKLRARGVGVIKALFSNREPGFDQALTYPADAFLCECSGGVLPGGNQKTWDWGQARGISPNKPLVLAGGLDPQNVGKAILAARPQAVDVSSSVEASPGQKDIQLVKRFIDNARLVSADFAKERAFK